MVPQGSTKWGQEWTQSRGGICEHCDAGGRQEGFKGGGSAPLTCTGAGAALLGRSITPSCTARICTSPTAPPWVTEKTTANSLAGCWCPCCSHTWLPHSLERGCRDPQAPSGWRVKPDCRQCSSSAGRLRLRLRPGQAAGMQPGTPVQSCSAAQTALPHPAAGRVCSAELCCTLCSQRQSPAPHRASQTVPSLAPSPLEGPQPGTESLRGSPVHF